MQVTQRNQKMQATCKSGAHPEEHTACCTLVQSLWANEAIPVPVEARPSGRAPEFALQDRQPVEPASFYVPVDINARYLKDPDFVDRERINRAEQHITLSPRGQVDREETGGVLEHDRMVTVWGPWCSRKVRLLQSSNGDKVSGEEYGLFPVDDRNFVELWILYEWWGITWRGGTRLHCMFEHMNAKYAIASGQKFMNKRLWYAACHKFVRSLQFMERTVDPAIDLCNICQQMTPFSITMDGQMLSSDKRLLHPAVLAAEMPHGDEVGVEDADHCICFPDDQADVLDVGETPSYDLDHNLPLSILSRCLQQHLYNADGGPMDVFERRPFSQAQKQILQKLGNWGKSFCRKLRLDPLPDNEVAAL